MKQQEQIDKGINNTKEAEDMQQEYKKVFNTGRNGWVS